MAEATGVPAGEAAGDDAALSCGPGEGAAGAASPPEAEQPDNHRSAAAKIILRASLAGVLVLLFWRTVILLLQLTHNPGTFNTLHEIPLHEQVDNDQRQDCQQNPCILDHAEVERIGLGIGAVLQQDLQIIRQ